MYRLHLYLTDDLKNKLDIKARISGKTKAEVAREALEEGLKKSKQIKSDSANALLKLAEMADGLEPEPNSPHDLSTSHDSYTWGEESINNE